MTAKCWLCGEELREKPERHHVKPRRYFRRGQNHRRGNIVKVHPSCHRRLHMEIDNPRLKWWQFKELMEPINYGENVFAD